MKRDLFELAGDLSRRGVSFVVATVVRRDGKSSAHQGDMALITAERGFHGWIGGGCTRPTVEREAALALAERRPRLLCLAPLPDRETRSGVLALPMPCHSGGTVEIYLDPVIAAPRLVLLGRSPIIQALAALGRGAGYRVDVADPEARADEVPGADRVLTSFEAPELRGSSGTPLLVVVATMGEQDEEAVRAALALAPSYLGVVASRPRFELLRQTLLASGVSAAALDTIASPAGLALGARGPGEVAISILAQIVARLHGIAGSELAMAKPPTPAAAQPAVAPRRLPVLGAPEVATAAAGEQVPGPADAIAGAPSGDAVDPVCLMAVSTARAVHIGTWDDRTWYFCCAGCKQKFLANPERYLAVASSGIGAVRGAAR